MAGFISQAEVSNAAGIRIAVQIVFAVDEVAEFNAIGFADSVADGVQLAVAGTFEDDFLVVGADQDFADPFVAFLLEREVFDFQRRFGIEVILLEDVVDFGRFQFLMLVVRNFLDEVAEVFAHLLRHVDAVVLFHNEAYAALAGLAVDADDVGIVGAAHIMRVDVQIRAGPVLFVVFFAEMHALGDGVLMGTGESGEDQLAGIRLTRMDMHAGHSFVCFHQFRHVGEIQARIDA